MKPAELRAVYRQVSNLSQLNSPELTRVAHETIDDYLALGEINEATRLALLQILYATATFVGERQS